MSGTAVAGNVGGGKGGVGGSGLSVGAVSQPDCLIDFLSGDLDGDETGRRNSMSLLRPL